MKTVLGKELGRALVKAVGAPIDGCLTVSTDIPVDGIATVSITYAVTGEMLAKVGELVLSGAMKDANLPTSS